MPGENLDLFGDPMVLPNGKRGRPAHRWTQKNANKVMMLLAVGWSNQRIANALHVSLPTLKRYYFSELKAREIQRDRMDAWRLETLALQADGGNVGAMRELNKMVERSDLMRREAALRQDPEERPEPEEKVGKKEAARRKAESLTKNSDNWGSLLSPGDYTQ